MRYWLLAWAIVVGLSARVQIISGIEACAQEPLVRIAGGTLAISRGVKFSTSLNTVTRQERIQSDMGDLSGIKGIRDYIISLYKTNRLVSSSNDITPAISKIICTGCSFDEAAKLLRDAGFYVRPANPLSPFYKYEYKFAIFASMAIKPNWFQDLDITIIVFPDMKQPSDLRIDHVAANVNLTSL